MRSAAAHTGKTEMTSCSGMASHGGAGQWHGAAHVPVHITQRDIKEFDCPGARDGTLGKRPQAQAFKSSGPFAGHGVRFLVRRRASAFALPLRTMRPVSRVRGTASMGMVAAQGINCLARGGEPMPKLSKWPSEAGRSSARTGRSRPCEGGNRCRIAIAAKTVSEFGIATECGSSAIISPNRSDGTQAASKGRKRSLSTEAESSQRKEAAVLARLSLAREPSHE